MFQPLKKYLGHKQTNMSLIYYIVLHISKSVLVSNRKAQNKSLHCLENQSVVWKVSRRPSQSEVFNQSATDKSETNSFILQRRPFPWPTWPTVWQIQDGEHWQQDSVSSFKLNVSQDLEWKMRWTSTKLQHSDFNSCPGRLISHGYSSSGQKLSIHAEQTEKGIRGEKLHRETMSLQADKKFNAPPLPPNTQSYLHRLVQTVIFH